MQDEREYTPKTICGIEIVEDLPETDFRVSNEFSHGYPVLIDPGCAMTLVTGERGAERFKRLAELFAQAPRMQKTLVGLWEEYMALHEAIDRLKEERADLVEALERMNGLHEKMMDKIDHGSSFFDAETLREMNEAPIQARKALAQARPERVEESHG